MRKAILVVGTLLAISTMAATAAQPGKVHGQPAMAAGADARSAQESFKEDERAIREAVEGFAKAYNAKDAKAVAALFTARGEIVDENGSCVQSREAIELAFARIFQAHPKSHIAVAVHSIRFVGQSVAVEDGTATVTDETGQPMEHNRYTVVHVKQDGTWRMASARDLPEQPATSAGEQLGQLAWLIGDWVDEGQSALVATSFRWADHRDFILSDFTVHVAGRPAMTGSQRIGWDPQARKLRSWVFDSEGGFVEGIWTRKGSQWIVKMTGVTRDGKTASSVNVFTRAAKDRMTWQSRDRVVGAEAMPNIDEIPIVRKPPGPQTAVHANHDSKGESL